MDQRPGLGRRKGRIIAVAAVTAALVVGGAVVRWLTMDGAPKPTAEPVVLVKFAASPEFARLPEDQKTPYLRAIRENLSAILRAAEQGQLTREEQLGAVRNVIRSRARLELREYSALPAGPARQAHLDKLIEEQEMLRQAAARVAAQSGKPVGPDPVMLKQFVESLAPDERVQMAAFVFDLISRRRQRGLPAWPFAGPDP